MVSTKLGSSLALTIVASFGLAGCGLYVPEKNILAPDTLDKDNLSSGGKYEDMIVIHILCETAVGLKKAYELVEAEEGTPAKLTQLAWLKDWGTAISLSITAEDQSGLSPGLTLTTPFNNRLFSFPTGGNVTSPQSFNFIIGGSASASATRAELIQYTYTNNGLLKVADGLLKISNKLSSNPPDYDDACKTSQTGVLIDSDLKIWEFIYDKAVIASNLNASAFVPIQEKDGTKLTDGGKKVPIFKTVGYTRHPSWPLYNTFTENITFTAILGGTVTPTWKLARVSANTSGSFLSATRTNTNQLTITMGPIQTQASATAPAKLVQGAQTQHDNTVLSNQIKTPQ
jgi:hypothetical protein